MANKKMLIAVSKSFVDKTPTLIKVLDRLKSKDLSESSKALIYTLHNEFNTALKTEEDNG